MDNEITLARRRAMIAQIAADLMTTTFSLNSSFAISSKACLSSISS